MRGDAPLAAGRHGNWGGSPSRNGSGRRLGLDGVGPRCPLLLSVGPPAQMLLEAQTARLDCTSARLTTHRDRAGRWAVETWGECASESRPRHGSGKQDSGEARVWQRAM